jgi:hypothetical protein
MTASRVAAQLNKESNMEVETVKGGLGEFSVYMDGRKVIDTNRLWYPTTSTMVKKIRLLLSGGFASKVL